MHVQQQTIDISGMGGGYEDQCQRMLWRGVAHLAEAKPPPKMWKQATTYQGIYGIMMTEGDALKALEAAIIQPGDDATGAMHQAVMSHLAYIHRHGVEQWLQDAQKQGGRKVISWEGDI